MGKISIFIPLRIETYLLLMTIFKDHIADINVIKDYSDICNTVIFLKIIV